MTPTPPVLLTYADAARLLDPDGRLKLTEHSIRSEVRAGRLPNVKFAGKVFIRADDLAEMTESRLCPDRPSRPALNSAGSQAARRSGKSTGPSRDVGASAQRALRTAERLIAASRRSARTSAPT